MQRGGQLVAAILELRLQIALESIKSTLSCACQLRQLSHLRLLQLVLCCKIGKIYQIGARTRDSLPYFLSRLAAPVLTALEIITPGSFTFLHQGILAAWQILVVRREQRGRVVVVLLLRIHVFHLRALILRKPDVVES